MLTHCAFLYSRCDFKAAQMNVQCSLIIIQELMLNKFTMGHNTMEANEKRLLCKRWGPFDHSSITRCFKKFCSGCKNLDYQTRSDKSKTVDSKVMPHNIETDLWQVALGEYQVSLTSHNPVWFITFIDLAEASRTAELCLKLPK